MAQTDEEKTERAWAALEVFADHWAVEVNLPHIVQAITGSPEKVEAFLRQSFMEGLYRGRTSPCRPLNDREDEYEATLDPTTYRILEDGPGRFAVVHDEWEECPIFETRQQAVNHVLYITGA